MQKLEKQWSILLWSMFLSIIVALSFITLSTKIHKNIKLWGESLIELSQKEKIQEAFELWKNSIIWENTVIIFEDNKEIILWMKQWDTHILTFTWTTDFDVELWVINWWAVEYNYEKWADMNTLISTSSWVINYSKSFSGELSWAYPVSRLELINHWWHSQLFVKSALNFETPEKNYKIITTIWNHSLIQSQGIIK